MGGVIASILFLLPLTFSLNSCKNSDDDDDSPTYYTITIAEGITHGTVSPDKESAVAGDTVTLTLAADEGYQFDALTVTDSNDTAITPTEVTAGSTYTFSMPECNVTVSATFTEIKTTENNDDAPVSPASSASSTSTQDYNWHDFNDPDEE